MTKEAEDAEHDSQGGEDNSEYDSRNSEQLHRVLNDVTNDLYYLVRLFSPSPLHPLPDLHLAFYQDLLLHRHDFWELHFLLCLQPSQCLHLTLFFHLPAILYLRCGKQFSEGKDHHKI
jgi:hypothetical protein